MTKLQIPKELLDTPISEFIKGAVNSETPREFIRNSENKFGMRHADIESMNEREFNCYIEHLDYLWSK